MCATGRVLAMAATGSATTTWLLRGAFQALALSHPVCKITNFSFYGTPRSLLLITPMRNSGLWLDYSCPMLGFLFTWACVSVDFLGGTFVIYVPISLFMVHYWLGFPLSWTETGTGVWWNVWLRYGPISFHLVRYWSINN